MGEAALESSKSDREGHKGTATTPSTEKSSTSITTTQTQTTTSTTTSTTSRSHPSTTSPSNLAKSPMTSLQSILKKKSAFTAKNLPSSSHPDGEPQQRGVRTTPLRRRRTLSSKPIRSTRVVVVRRGKVSQAQPQPRPRAFTRKTLRRKAMEAEAAATAAAEGLQRQSSSAAAAARTVLNMTNRTTAAKTMTSSIVDDASPPWHTAALISILTAILLRHCVPSASLDNVARRETFMHVLFPKVFSIQDVATIRLLLGTGMLGHSLYIFLWANWDQGTVYLRGSHLRSVSRIPFRGVFSAKKLSLTSGWLTLSRLTSVLILLQGGSMVLAGGIPWYIVLTRGRKDVPAWIMRLCLLLWEISAPPSILISAMVKYVLWPSVNHETRAQDVRQRLKHHADATALFLNTPHALFEHNANVICSLMEVCLLGRLPIRFDHVGLAPLFGLLYVVYSYSLVDALPSVMDDVIVTIPKQGTTTPDKSRPQQHRTKPYTRVQRSASAAYGPQFLYPFLDTTLEWITTVSLMVFLLALTASYLVLAWLQHSMSSGGGGHYSMDDTCSSHDVSSSGSSIYMHAATLVAVGAAVCRFGD